MKSINEKLYARASRFNYTVLQETLYKDYFYKINSDLGLFMFLRLFSPLWNRCLSLLFL